MGKRIKCPSCKMEVERSEELRKCPVCKKLGCDSCVDIMSGCKSCRDKKGK